MILPRDRIDSILAGAPFQRRIFDVPDMYGWICGHLNDDPVRPTHQYSDLWVAAPKRHRCIYARDRLYPLSTGYGEPVLGHIRLVCIYRQDVREITGADAQAEGYRDKMDFLTTWIQEHDPVMTSEIWQASHMPEAVNHCPVFLWDRPYEPYSAWVLRFKLPEKEMQGEQDKTAHSRE